MSRRTLFVILGAVALALVVGLLWFWFFRSVELPPQGTGGFGTGQNAQTGTTGEASNQNNIGSGVLDGSGGNTTGASVQTGAGRSGISAGGGIQTVSGVQTVPGVDWLGSSGSGGGISLNGPTTSFVPKAINQLNDGSVGGTPGLIGGFGNTGAGAGKSNTDFGLGGLLGGAAGCAMYAAFQGFGEAKAGVEGGLALGAGLVFVYDLRVNSKQATKEFESIGDCLARTIGRAVIQQMTNSIVNWINSGFNGKPSFVTNFQQFFSNVGDQAAGEFIRGTALSFLCSPFQLQIRIAIAQSYARRNNAASCTISGIVKNLNSFMNGNFSAGGWKGLLQFTTVPTNNPFGAYAYAQVGLSNAQNNALSNAKNNLSPGGFISLQKCNPPESRKPEDCKVVTPGKVIESTLEETLKQPYLANQLAQSFDQIISALLNQLMTKTLYSGLSSLSGANGYAANYLTPEQQQAQNTAQALVTDMQGRLQVAQQYGAAQQGSIRDIQDAQQNLQDLANCYSAKGQTAQASSTLEILQAYNGAVDTHNNNITKANAGIALLQELQTRAISVTSAADVSAVQGAYQQALASGKLPSQADVTQAQQNRSTLQSSLAGRNAATSVALQQCNAS